MYCIIKFAEFDEKRPLNEQSAKSHHSVKPSPSKICLHENKILLVNPDCYTQILIDYIASEIKFDKNSNFDFCDESGELMNIKSLKPWQNATVVLESQNTYFVILYEKDDMGQFIFLEPILNQYSKEYFDLMAKLKKRMPSVKRLSTESRRSRRRSADEVLSKAKITSRASLLQDNEITSRRKSVTKSAASQGKSVSLRKIAKNLP